MCCLSCVEFIQVLRVEFVPGFYQPRPGARVCFLGLGKDRPDLWVVSAHSSNLLCKVFLGWCPDSSEELLGEVPTSLGCAKFRLSPGYFHENPV